MAYYGNSNNWGGNNFQGQMGMNQMGGMNNMNNMGMNNMGMNNMGMNNMGMMNRGMGNRGGMNSGMGQRNDGKGNNFEEGSYKVRFMVSSRAIGSVIGKGGQKIRTVREETGAKVQIDQDGYPERVISITHDTRDKVIETLEAIINNVNDDFSKEPPNKQPPIIQGRGQKRPQQGEMQICVLVNEHDCQAVIGARGQRVRQYVTDTNCQVFIHNEYLNMSEYLPNSNEKVVTITGTSDCIPRAVSKMLSHLEEECARGHKVMTWDMKKDGPCGFFGNQATWKGSGMEKFATGPMQPAMNMQGMDPFVQKIKVEKNGNNYRSTINADQAAIIIGSRGVRINDIRNMSGATIVISEPEQDMCKRKLEISGSDVSASNAIWLINITINAFCDPSTSVCPFSSDMSLSDIVCTNSYGQPPGLAMAPEVPNVNQNGNQFNNQNQNGNQGNNTGSGFKQENVSSGGWANASSFPGQQNNQQATTGWTNA